MFDPVVLAVAMCCTKKVTSGKLSIKLAMVPNLPMDFNFLLVSHCDTVNIDSR